MKKSFVCLLASLTIAAASWAADLNVGDAAPPIDVGETLAGSMPASLAAGTPYVVELWATWADGSVADLKHLAEVSKKHPDAKVLAVAVGEADAASVKVWLTEQIGADLGYAVALDKPGTAEAPGPVAQQWLLDSQVGMVPVAFIVDQDGKVAWAGLARDVEDPLAQVVGKTWDLAQATADFAAAKHRAFLLAQAEQALQDENLDQAGRIKVVRDWFAADPEAEVDYWPTLWAELDRQDDKTTADAYLQSRLDALGDDPEVLSQAAFYLLQVENPSKTTLTAALTLAQRVDTALKGEDAVAAALIMRANTMLGHKVEAIAAGERAVVLAGEEPYAEPIKQWLEEAKALPDTP